MEISSQSWEHTLQFQETKLQREKNRAINAAIVLKQHVEREEWDLAAAAAVLTGQHSIQVVSTLLDVEIARQHQNSKLFTDEELGELPVQIYVKTAWYATTVYAPGWPWRIRIPQYNAPPIDLWNVEEVGNFVKENREW